jgi:hypothetical protein
MTESWPAPTLTAALLGPPDLGVVEDRSSVVDAAKRIPRVLADLAVPRLGATSLRLTDHHVRTALTCEDYTGAADAGTPFAWSPRTARRALGLAAVRAIVAGEVKSPIDGTRAAMAKAIRSVRDGERSTSMDRWLTGLPAAGLAVVEADAVTWATRLWCALDWNAFDELPMIGRDRWWNSPHSSLLAIRSRAEVRSVTHDKMGDPFSVHLVVLGGKRRITIRSELSVVAMVEALLAPRSIPPGRIVGWWPDSGHQIKVDIDQEVMAEGVATITRTLARAEATAVPFEGLARAAA